MANITLKVIHMVIRNGAFQQIAYCFLLVFHWNYVSILYISKILCICHLK